MSLYNMLFGMNPMSDTFLAMLNLDRRTVGRFRDCFIDHDGDQLILAIFTRNGGGNRDHWSDEKESGMECGCCGCVITHNLPKHPLYIRDFDDDFDSTYATVLFKVPEKYVQFIKDLDELNPDTPKPMERFKGVIDKLKAHEKDDPDVQRIMETMKPVIKAITKALEEAK